MSNAASTAYERRKEGLMHFSMLVLTDAPDVDRENAANVIEPLLEPHREDYDEATDELTGHWDWWVVGGRWTGALTGYKPNEDPANRETCKLCGGSGDRAAYRNEARHLQHATGCNGCLGTGIETKWPTDWKGHDGDVTPAANLNGGDWPSLIAGVVTPDGEWHGGLMADYPKDKIRELVSAHPDATAIVVDCHV
jgi:hypothetical protein